MHTHLLLELQLDDLTQALSQPQPVIVLHQAVIEHAQHLMRPQLDHAQPILHVFIGLGDALHASHVPQRCGVTAA